MFVARITGSPTRHIRRLDDRGGRLRYRPAMASAPYAAPTVAWIDGNMLAFADASVPLEDRGLQFGESLYEVVPLCHGRVHMLGEHVERMRAAAALLGLQDGVPSNERCETIVARLWDVERLDEGLLYLQLTGGTTSRVHVPSIRPTPKLIAYLMSFQFPRDEHVRTGIAAITQSDERWARCDLKTTMLLPTVLWKRAARARGAREVIFCGPSDQIHEGGSSNIFVVRAGQIVHPGPSAHLLPGITGPLVRSLALEAGLTIHPTPIVRADLFEAEEVFVTSTTFLVMPVVQVDERPIGRGVSGPVAIDLAARLRRRLELE